MSHIPICLGAAQAPNEARSSGSSPLFLLGIEETEEKYGYKSLCFC